MILKRKTLFLKIVQDLIQEYNAATKSDYFSYSAPQTI